MFGRPFIFLSFFFKIKIYKKSVKFVDYYYYFFFCVCVWIMIRDRAHVLTF